MAVIDLSLPNHGCKIKQVWEINKVFQVFFLGVWVEKSQTNEEAAAGM